MRREYGSIWDIIKTFIKIWCIGLMLILVVSCYIHWNDIVSIVTKKTWSMIEGLLPLIIMVSSIIYIIRIPFKK